MKRRIQIFLLTTGLLWTAAYVAQEFVIRDRTTGNPAEVTGNRLQVDANVSALSVELSTVEANTGATAAGIGTATDAACTAGSTGSLNCKERLMTSQLDAIQTAVQTLDNAIGTNGIKIRASDDSAIGATADPCDGARKTTVPIDIVTATTVELANAVASEFFWICSIDLHTNAANNVTIAEDDTDGCGSPSAGVTGGVTAAEGYNFAANGGRTLGNGNGTVARTTTANRYLCILTSAATQLSGSITFVSAQ